VTRRRVNNPLALAVLGCLAERPMHPYEISTTLRTRGKEKSIKLNYLNEPLAHKDAIWHVEYAKKKGVLDVMMNTNATKMIRCTVRIFPVSAVSSVTCT